MSDRRPERNSARHRAVARETEDAVAQAITERDGIVMCPACSDDAGTPIWHEPQPPEHQTIPSPTYREQAEELVRAAEYISEQDARVQAAVAAERAASARLRAALEQICNLPVFAHHGQAYAIAEAALRAPGPPAP